MENKNLNILKKEFRKSNQKVQLLKLTTLVYLLKDKEHKYTIIDKCNNITDYVNSIMSIIQFESNNKKENEIRNLCKFTIPDSLDLNYDSYYYLSLVDSLSKEEIKEFIINEVNFSNDRDDAITPISLADLVINILYRNDNQSWYDLGCGTGEFLMRLSEMKNTHSIYGDEISFDKYLLFKIKSYLLNKEFNIFEKDVLITQYNEDVDVAYVHTPFLQKLSKDVNAYNDKNKYIADIKSSQNSDWVFVDRVLQTIKDRAVVLMTEASLMNTIDQEQRKSIIEKNLIEGIIKLPSNIFSYTGISVSMLILNKNKKSKEIKFLNASNMCTEGRRYNELNIEKILNSYNDDKDTININIETISNDYNLNVIKYINNNDIKLENEVILEEVVHEIFRGAQIPAQIIDEFSNITDEDKVYKLVSLGDINNGIFDVDSLQIIKDNGKYDRYLVTNNDLLVSAKSTKIKTSIVRINETDKVIATGSLLVIRCNTNKIDPIYLKTFFDSKNGSKLLESIQTGTVIMSINASALLKMKISYFDIKKQSNISKKYLETLEKYRQINNELESIKTKMNNIFDNNI